MTTRPLSLTVWFDGDCTFCRRVAAWIEAQPKYVPVRCIATQQASARGCPLDPQALLQQVTVTADDGAVWRGSNAWILVLWALRSYRGWSLLFAKPRWRPKADRLFASIAGVAAWTKKRHRR